MSVQAGDKFRFPGCPEAVVTRVERDSIFGDTYVYYYYPEYRGSTTVEHVTTLEAVEKHLVTSFEVGDTVDLDGHQGVITDVFTDSVHGPSLVVNNDLQMTLKEAEEHLVKDEYPYGEPFPTGSIVQFKRTRYRVDGFDGEHHDLTPEDGDVEGRLYFSPDFFELVRPPFPEIHSVWEDRDGHRYYVRHNDEVKNLVWLKRFDMSEQGISVEQLHDRYTKLA